MHYRTTTPFSYMDVQQINIYTVYWSWWSLQTNIATTWTTQPNVGRNHFHCLYILQRVEKVVLISLLSRGCCMCRMLRRWRRWWSREAAAGWRWGACPCLGSPPRWSSRPRPHGPASRPPLRGGRRCRSLATASMTWPAKAGTGLLLQAPLRIRTWWEPKRRTVEWSSEVCNGSSW